MTEVCEWPTLFRNLRSLRLPLCVVDDMCSPDDEPARGTLRLLNAIPDTIEDLTLAASSLQEAFERAHAKQSDRGYALYPFDTLISHLRFPRLQTLDLRGWVVTLSELEKFLLAHTSTLRTLHLIDMYVCRDIGDKGTIVDFVGDKLALTGIEIPRLRYKDTPPEPTSTDDDDDDDDDIQDAADGEVGHDAVDEPAEVAQHDGLNEHNDAHVPASPNPYDNPEVFFGTVGPDEDLSDEESDGRSPWRLRTGTPYSQSEREWPSRRDHSSDEGGFPSDDENPLADEPFIREAEKETLAEQKCLGGRRNDIHKRIRPIGRTWEERGPAFGRKMAYW